MNRGGYNNSNRGGYRGGGGGGGGRQGPPPKVDREKTTPFLLRTFVKLGSHHPDSEFSIDRLPTPDEYQLYSWHDSTVRELLLLLRDVAPSLRTNPLARYSIRLVFFDNQSGKYTSREIAMIQARDVVSAQPNYRPDKTLDHARFVIGDYLDIAYIVGGGPGDRPIGGGGAQGRDSAPHMGGGRGSFAPLPPPGRGGPPFNGRDGRDAGGREGPSAREAWGVPMGGGNDRRGGGGGFRGGPPPPRDQGWGGGNRGGRPSNGDAPRRRDSRSRSPPPRRESVRSRSRSRSRSPPPRPRE